jgi:dolichol-phosphate mannosyltransferase/undecaprenyl-phosphate 4-deoxy-4-formamido-L-arabinose transferase
MNSKIDLSVVVPVYRSASSLDELCERILEVGQALNLTTELILVDDCSPDESWSVIARLADQHAPICGIQLMANRGQGAATLCGLEQSAGEYIVTIDDDLQFAPEEISNLWERLQSNDAVDVVIGIPEERRHRFYRNVGSCLINRINTLFLKKPLNLKFSGFRIMRRPVLAGLLCIRNPYPAIGPMILSVTPRIVNLSVSHFERRHGVSNYDFPRLMRQALANLIGYSILPLHAMATIGVLGLVGSIAMGSYYLWRYFFIGIATPGWTSLMLVLIALFGFNFFALALIGEYLKRLYQMQSQASSHQVRQVTGE